MFVFNSCFRCAPDELVEILETINPANKAGKVTLITRMSSKVLEVHLPKLILAVQKAGLNVSLPGRMSSFAPRFGGTFGIWCVRGCVYSSSRAYPGIYPSMASATRFGTRVPQSKYPTRY